MSHRRANLTLARQAVQDRILNALRGETIELRNEIEKVEEEKNILRIELDELKKKHELSEKEKEEIRNQLGNLKENYEIIGKRVDSQVEELKRINVKRAKDRIQIEQLQNELNKYKESLFNSGRKDKEYKELTEESKNSRVKKIVKFIEEDVGKENLDDFMKKLVKIVSQDPNNTFSVKLSPWSSFYLATKLQLTDCFIKEFKHHCQKETGFDCFVSRKVIDKIRHESNPYDDYNITVEVTNKVTKNGKDVSVSTPVATMKDVESCVVRRLEALSKRNAIIFDESTGTDIVLCITGDKGASVTKLCLAFGNITTPNNPHSLLLLGFYSGPDDHEHLQSRLGSVFSQLNAMKTVKFHMKGQLEEFAVRLLVIGDCKFMSAVFHHPGQSSKCPCYMCHISWIMKGNRVDTVGKFAFDKPGRPRTLLELKDGKEALIDIEPSKSGIPPLHSLTGLLQYYVIDFLHGYCNRLDSTANLPESLKEQRKLMNCFVKEENIYSKRVDGLKKSLETANAILVGFTKIQRAHKGRKPSDPTCQAAFCMIHWIEPKFRNQESFVCSECKSTVHLSCAVLLTPDDEARIEDGSAKCLVCTKKPNCVTFGDFEQCIRSAITSISKHLGDDELVLHKFMEQRMDLQMRLDKSKGATRQDMEKVLGELRCDPRTILKRKSALLTTFINRAYLLKTYHELL